MAGRHHFSHCILAAFCRHFIKEWWWWWWIARPAFVSKTTHNITSHCPSSRFCQSSSVTCFRSAVIKRGKVNKMPKNKTTDAIITLIIENCYSIIDVPKYRIRPNRRPMVKCGREDLRTWDVDTGKMRRCGVADFWHTAGSTLFWLPRTILTTLIIAVNRRFTYIQWKSDSGISAACVGKMRMFIRVFIRILPPAPTDNNWTMKWNWK